MNQEHKPMYQYTIYQNPTDFPEECYVVRAWQINTGTGQPEHSMVVLVHTDLEYCRSRMQHLGLHCIPAMPGDDPVIVESWI